MVIVRTVWSVNNIYRNDLQIIIITIEKRERSVIFFNKIIKHIYIIQQPICIFDYAIYLHYDYIIPGI